MLKTVEDWNTYFRFINYQRKFKKPAKVLYNTLRNQAGKCAICKSTFTKTPMLDHSHNTGKVRGFLCASCNVMLGKFGDSVKLFKSAIKYLKKYQ